MFDPNFEHNNFDPNFDPNFEHKFDPNFEHNFGPNLDHNFGTCHFKAFYHSGTKHKRLCSKIIFPKVGGVGGCPQFIFFRNLNKAHLLLRRANINKQFVCHFKKKLSQFLQTKILSKNTDQQK